MKYMYSNTKIYKKHWLNKREYWREKKYSKNFSVTFFICRYPMRRYLSRTIEFLHYMVPKRLQVVTIFGYFLKSNKEKS